MATEETFGNMLNEKVMPAKPKKKEPKKIKNLADLKEKAKAMGATSMVTKQGKVAY